MPFHIYGPLSQTREPPRPGTQGPRGPLILQQTQGTCSRLLRSCDAPVNINKYCFNILGLVGTAVNYQKSFYPWENGICCNMETVGLGLINRLVRDVSLA